MADLTPAQLADLDRSHAAAQEDLDDLIEAHRGEVAHRGDILATGRLMVSLYEVQSHDVAAGFAALAINRLAKLGSAAPVFGDPIEWGADDITAAAQILAALGYREPAQAVRDLADRHAALTAEVERWQLTDRAHDVLGQPCASTQPNQKETTP